MTSSIVEQAPGNLVPRFSPRSLPRGETLGMTLVSWKMLILVENWSIIDKFMVDNAARCNGLVNVSR